MVVFEVDLFERTQSAEDQSKHGRSMAKQQTHVLADEMQASASASASNPNLMASLSRKLDQRCYL